MKTILIFSLCLGMALPPQTALGEEPLPNKMRSTPISLPGLLGGPKVIVARIGVSKSEIRSFSNVNSKNRIRTLSELQRDLSYQSQPEDELIEAFKKAQIEFLEGDLGVAAESFKGVTSMALLADWDDGNRKLIHNSFFRLAQIEDQNSEIWLSKAADFDPQSHIEESLFPPPLVEKYKKMIGSQNTKSFASIFGSDLVVSINGRVFKNGDLIHINDSSDSNKKRVTVYSDFHLSRTEVLDQREFSKIVKWLEPVLDGNCKSPQLTDSGRNLQENILAIYPNRCLALINSEGVAFEMKLQKNPTENTFAGFSNKATPITRSYSNHSVPSLENDHKPEESKSNSNLRPFYPEIETKSSHSFTVGREPSPSNYKWVWPVVIGTAVAAIVIAASIESSSSGDKGKTKTEPVHE